MTPLEQKLLNLLSNQDVTFFIPPYQRNYEWIDAQCKIFFEDVKKTCDNNMNGIDDEHFFGSITFFQDETNFGEPNKLVLIDGQQRITTTMLFLVAIRDTLHEDENICKLINSRYLKNDNATGSDDEYKVKLKQVETDWQSFKDLVLGNPLSDKAKTSAVYQNYKFFCNALKAYKENGKDIKSLISYGIDKFSVVTIELKPKMNRWENPQEIFESMNSLGKPLSLADLVRNYLLLGLDANRQTELYNKYWLHIENILPEKISDFIRDYMQCLRRCSYPKSTEVNYKELYSEFKNISGGTNADVEGILKNLSEYSTLYAYIVGNAASGNAKLDTILADLRSIRITTAHSFILALLREWKCERFTDDDIVEIMDAFRINCFRRRLVTLTKAENMGYPLLVKKIPDLKAATDKRLKMFEILAKQETNLRLPNDIEVANELKSMNFYSFQYKKLYLSLVEEKLTKSRPDQSDSVLQVEHIMPHTLNDEWRKELGDDAEMIHQTYADNIGNLTLIRHNQELGQKSFKDKKVVYAGNEGLQIAKTEITNQDKWNETTIINRMNWIVNYLTTNVLPIPDSMRRTNNFSVDRKRKLSFIELQLIGEYINFRDDKSIRAKVVNDHEVEYDGEKIRLSPLTKKIKRLKGTATPSESYQGAQYWEYDGVLLADII